MYNKIQKIKICLKKNRFSHVYYPLTRMTKLCRKMPLKNKRDCDKQLTKNKIIMMTLDSDTILLS